MDYILNKDKTARNGKTAETLEDAVGYALNRSKTEQDCFESGICCLPETAFEEMRHTKERWGKTGGVEGYHLVQSFAEGEVTPELAHRIGLELADRLLEGKYEAVIGTHLNTGHIHNHILWNSVRYTDGKKYHSNARSYYRDIRRISDELCRSYWLSVIEKEGIHPSDAKPYVEWCADKNGKPTWRTAIRQDVDEAVLLSLTWKQFAGRLESQGYEIRMCGKYPTLRPPGKQRWVRFKTLGAKYTPEAIQLRILYPAKRFAPQRLQATPRTCHGRLKNSKKPYKKLTGLRALYMVYLYKLGVLKHRPRRPGYALREDIWKLDKRIAQLQYLSKNSIDSREQLSARREALSAQIQSLSEQRRRGARQDPDSPQIEALGQQLKALRAEDKMCREIIAHSEQIEARLKAAQAEQQQLEQKKKEMQRERQARRNKVWRAN